MGLTNYWWLLLWPLAAGALGLLASRESGPSLSGNRGDLPGLLAGAPLVLWAALRPDAFGDTGTYRARFHSAPETLGALGGYLRSLPRDRGYGALEVGFKALLSRSDRWFFLLIAALQLLCLLWVWRRYSRNTWLSLYLFVASTDYLSWMWNGSRQFLAAALIFAALPLLVRRSYGAMVLAVLAASCFHLSALIFLPAILAAPGKPWNLRLLAVLVLMTAGVLYLDRNSGLLQPLAERTGSTGVLEYLGDGGVHPLRALFYAIPTAMCLVFRRRILEAGDPMIQLCVNLSAISTALYLAGVFTSGILVGRLPIYFSLANYILIPWLIEEIFTPDSAAWVEAGFLGTYAVFFVCQLRMVWGLL